MTHQQILDKLAARHLVRAMDEDFAYALSQAMLGGGFSEAAEQRVWEQMKARWECAIDGSDEEASPVYRQKAILAMAIVAHKYGLCVDEIRARAFDAIDALNNAVALSDDFERKSGEIKAFLSAPPTPPKRRPATGENITFYRAGDVICVRYKGKFYAAYIHGDTGINEAPIIEFYDGVFSGVPSLEAVLNLRAKGAGYSDGARVQKFAVMGMKYLPDPAGQITLLGSAVSTPPSSDHLMPSVGLWALSNIFSLQKEIARLFGAEI